MDMTDPKVKERTDAICAQVHPMMVASFSSLLAGGDWEAQQAAMVDACDMGEKVAMGLITAIGMAQNACAADPALDGDPTALSAALQEKGHPGPIADRVAEETCLMRAKMAEVAGMDASAMADQILADAMAATGRSDAPSSISERMGELAASVRQADADGSRDYSDAEIQADLAAMQRIVAMTFYYYLRQVDFDSCRERVLETVVAIVDPDRRDELADIFELTGFCLDQVPPDAEADVQVAALLEHGIPQHLVAELIVMFSRMRSSLMAEIQGTQLAHSKDPAAKRPAAAQSAQINQLAKILEHYMTLRTKGVDQQAAVAKIEAKFAKVDPSIRQSAVATATDVGFLLLSSDYLDTRSNVMLFGQLLRLRGSHYALANMLSANHSDVVQLVETIRVANLPKDKRKAINKQQRAHAKRVSDSKKPKQVNEFVTLGVLALLALIIYIAVKLA